MALVQGTPAVEHEGVADRLGAAIPSPAARAGLSEAEASRRLASRGGSGEIATSRSYASIVRANVFTVFNLILAAFGVLTLAFGDWRDALFLGILVANTAIGITQEVRAKRALDRLALLVAPRATVLRDGNTRSLPAAEVVEGDLVAVQAGDQIVADGELCDAADLRLDESILTGESEPVPRVVGGKLRSGAFVAEGSGSYRVTAVGAGSYAGQLLGEARSFRHPRSPLEQAVNRLLLALVALVILLGAALGYSLWHRQHPGSRSGSDGDRGRGQPGPRGADRADQPRLRGGVNPHGPAWGPLPTAQRHRVAGLGGRNLPRQDGHAHRGRASPHRRDTGERRQRLGGAAQALRRERLAT
jgi:hypothetical protein